MSVIQITDAGGCELTVYELDGRKYPTYKPEALKAIAQFKARPDDVVIHAYPKSGTHWVWEVVRVLLAGSTDLPLVEKDGGMIERTVPQEMEAAPSPRILNSHLHFDRLPPDLFAQKVKLIHVTRDPRDLSVSYFNHHIKLAHYYNYKGQWKDYFRLFLDGQVDFDSWFDYTKDCEKGFADNPDLPVHVTSFEALKENPFEETQKIAKFLGVNADDDFVAEVVKKTSFDVMRNTKGKEELCKKTGSPIMYRKGIVGDWRNWYTVAQSEEFEAVFEEKMRGTNAYQLYSKKGQSPSDTNMNSK